MVLANVIRVAALCAGACGCGSGLELIPTGPHPLSGGAMPVAVDSEPPAAQIEEIPSAPNRDCAWADGQWTWADNRWQWQPGRWVQAQDGCYYAHALMVWVPTVSGPGALFYTHGQWYQEGGTGICAEPSNC